MKRRPHIMHCLWRNTIENDQDSYSDKWKKGMKDTISEVLGKANTFTIIELDEESADNV